ncbi:MAG: ferrous iron transport protein A [Planctomycetes bacterium]|nr:ferrous iron transport protein A [Planctomycetota bacterium]
MSLSGVTEGKTVRLVRVDAGCGLRSRLTAMGLVPGVELQVVRNGGRGPFIVAVKGTRIMLGRGMAEHIVVR